MKDLLFGIELICMLIKANIIYVYHKILWILNISNDTQWRLKR